MVLVDSERCFDCGFDSLVSSTRHGGHWVRLDRLTDAAHCLGLREIRKLEALLNDFERRFPQVFLAVYIGVLPQGLRVTEVGFWLLNHAAFGTDDLAKRNEFGIVLVIDPAAGMACFTLGYAIEALTAKLEINDILSRLRPFLLRSHYCDAVLKAIGDLDRQLRSIGQPRRRDHVHSSAFAVPPDLGLARIWNSSCDESSFPKRISTRQG